MEPGTLPDDCDIALMFTINAENEQELKGKEETVRDIGRLYKGTYLPGHAENFFNQYPTPFIGLRRPSKSPAEAPVPANAPRISVYLFDELIFPASRFAEVYNKIKEITGSYGLWGLPYPTAFSGFPMSHQVICAPVGVAFDDSNPDLLDRFYKCQSEFREWFGKKGGTFQYRLPPEVPDYVWTNQPGAYKLLKSIKASLDPDNILSPGTFQPGDM